jgi:chlorobactene glucosyltransferase
MELLLLTLPWTVVVLYMVVMVRLPPRLPPPGAWDERAPPSVSMIVPARNEEGNIGKLLHSLARTEYPDFEIIVVDDESEDLTRDRVRESPPGNAGRIHLVDGAPPPEGWLGKPWACHQGALEAKGDLLLFTDADTVHAPGLLSQGVRALLDEEADVLTVVGRQVMGSFWERLLQPQFFALLVFRFPRAGTPRGPERWREAIANGQYLLFHRQVYEALGGHAVVRGEVVEDMRLAHLLARSGERLVVREGPGLRTRMYDSLGSLVEGWAKNITTGALQTVPGWFRPFILPVSFLTGFILWLLPLLILAWALTIQAGGLTLALGISTTAFGVFFWGLVSWFMGASPLYGLAFPLGSVMLTYIFFLSWVRGRSIRWKGREYEVSQETEGV